MAFNKSKALENALKFLNQGKVPQAIAEYQLILRADPRDQATLMTVGDLFARQGDMPHAIEYFERLAQVYLGDGFNSKAIAIYKKIAKLAPNELAPLERLADLYVQQGVLSEARPLFLQIAEAHLKANHAQKAVEVLHRLLDVEPENQRVQMRLAELYGMMGQKKEAAQTYLNYAQRLFERGEADEAEKLVERSLEMDPASPAAVLLKGKSLAQLEKLDAAIATLGSHPEAGNGGEVTHLLVDLELRANKPEQAAQRARRLMAAAPASYTLLYQVVETLIENGHADAALPLLAELRAPMIEHGAQENYLKSLSAACTALPGRTDALEQLADFCRHASQPFHLNTALGQLSDAYAAKGDFARAEQALVEMVDRNKNDERVVERLNQLRARAGGSAMPAAPEPVEIAPPGPEERFEEPAAAAPVAAAPEEFLDEETQQYIAQALTDVDLFSSYGLTQKATHLLENVLQKAPRHTPTLERLLDLYLGAGNDRRTAELASQLDQIHRERGDIANADRFAELTRRYSKVAGLSAEDLPPVPPAPVQVAQPSAEVHSSVSVPAFEAPVAASEPLAEAAAFEIESAPAGPHVEAPSEVASEPPAFELAPEPVRQAAPPAPAKPAAVPIEFEVPLVSLEDEPVAHVPEPLVEEPAPVEVAAEGSEELDLSDEWESIASEPANAEVAEPLTMTGNLDPVVEPEALTIEEPVAQAESVPAFDEEPEPAPKFDAFHIEENMGQSDLISESAVETASPAAAGDVHTAAQQAQPEFEIAAEIPGEVSSDPAFEIPAQSAMEIPQTVSAEELAAIFDAPLPPSHTSEAAAPEPVAAQAEAPDAAEFELELTPESTPAKASGPANTEDFISELVAELEDLEAPATVAQQPHAEPVHEKLTEVFASAPVAPMAAASTPAPVAANGHANLGSLNVEAATPSAESLNQLAEVFQEFRSELGEMSDEDEDLETHYNLGIAYREMGLLDEAIGEFQKVAKAVQKGKPFPYMMNCSTMLGLTFMDKGEPKVASLWYQRALETPGLEEESILALRYDLGMALEAAGESKAALDSFRNVYAMNIDYRDVADRIALIQKR
jgi:tetratricopeptide (TPR) repeat protein